ncbi:hypothetical protein [Agromyces mangrovi Wang et al. 2018]|uniref:hypothetical protein n=1 Tax=Agromyces mangrovi TaxID=1858653 RepID=UPI00257342A2|nr:hypothetical protein [Agromyces mangrovi]BDZ64110.1 hypothetical protein GCM10025877_10480 [Agromyces mangrovi]
MPADEYFEHHREHETDASGHWVPTADDPWGGMPEPRRLEWCRALLDFPPTFPGPTIMTFAAARIRSGGSVHIIDWTAQAMALEAVGFGPAEFMLLRLAIAKRVDELRARDDGRFVIDTMVVGYPSLTLIAADWADWLEFVAAGLTPLRAADLVIDGDRRSWPGGFIRGRDGTDWLTA